MTEGCARVSAKDSRAERLRCLGNQVVATQAACAFVLLARRLNEP